MDKRTNRAHVSMHVRGTDGCNYICLLVYGYAYTYWMCNHEDMIQISIIEFLYLSVSLPVCLSISLSAEKLQNKTRLLTRVMNLKAIMSAPPKPSPTLRNEGLTYDREWCTIYVILSYK